MAGAAGTGFPCCTTLAFDSSQMAACTLFLLGTSALVGLYCTKDHIYINRGRVGHKVKMRRLEEKPVA